MKIGSAIFDETQKYRYYLTRPPSTSIDFRPIEIKPVAFVMLNPSTADAEQDDPTIRRCRGFAERWGSAGLIVVNLFGLRSTDPKGLRTEEWPVGTLNLRYILEAGLNAHKIVCAWGNHGEYMNQGAMVKRLLLEKFQQLWCFGITQTKQPIHPLYQPYDRSLIPFI